MTREADMLAPLRRWLRKTNRIGHRTVEVSELGWLGRRVDFVTMTACGITSAYEMKLRDNSCGIEQAAKNAHSFARSYLVTATMPSAGNLALAREVGIGIIYLNASQTSILLAAPTRSVADDVKVRLQADIELARNLADV